jgi:hypothetical protein
MRVFSVFLRYKLATTRHQDIERHAGGESSSLPAAGPPVAASVATEFPHCVVTLRTLPMRSAGNGRLLEYKYHCDGLVTQLR